MKFKELMELIPADVYVEAFIINLTSFTEVDRFGFFESNYEGDICDKLDNLTVHYIDPKEFGELNVFLQESDK